jgi:hypothetical protein
MISSEGRTLKKLQTYCYDESSFIMMYQLKDTFLVCESMAPPFPVLAQEANEYVSKNMTRSLRNQKHKKMMQSTNQWKLNK